MLARDDRALDADVGRHFEELLARRVAGEPFAYLIGEREFFGRRFAVDDRVLIPRPETEHLVEACLELDLPPAPTILDVGTGSGCIAVTLALEIETSRLLAVDRAPGACAVARGNAVRLGAPGVRVVNVDLATALRLGRFDLVTSNPPYIARGDHVRLSSEITDYEPPPALFAGESGLELFDRLLRSLRPLEPGTPVVLEVGDGQAEAVVDLAAGHGFRRRSVIADYAGTQRVVVINQRTPPVR